VLTVKLGVATKRDLAQMCAEAYSPRFAVFLWITAEIAIAACDLAEVIGTLGFPSFGRTRALPLLIFICSSSFLSVTVISYQWDRLRYCFATSLWAPASMGMLFDSSRCERDIKE